MISTRTAGRDDQHPPAAPSLICTRAVTHPVSGSDDAERGTMVTRMSTFHDFEMTSITGDQVSFDRFDDQICLIVNVASA